ncbi:hypothetical protein E2320_011568, partial [Naja naja]
MRRSAAPSQLLGHSAKKPRFIPPGKMLQKTSEYVDPEIKTDEVCERRLCSSTSVNICSTTSDFHSSVTVKSKEEELPCDNKNMVIGHLKTGRKSLCRTTI